jgi:hypothetical protein
MTDFLTTPTFAAVSTAGDTAAATALADKQWILDLEDDKGLSLSVWLFAYICLHDTLCSAPCAMVQRISVDMAEVVYSGLGGKVTLHLDFEANAKGDVKSFELAGVTATPRLRMLADLRFDTRDVDNPLIGLTHCLYHIVELRAADILAALNNPDLLAG